MYIIWYVLLVFMYIHIYTYIHMLPIIIINIHNASILISIIIQMVV